MRMLRGELILGLALLTVANAAQAQAEPPFDAAIGVQLFEYSLGQRSFLTVDNAELTGPGALSADLLVTFLTHPFTVWNVRDDDLTSERTEVVQTLLAAEAVLAYGLSPRLQLGVALPVIFSITGEGLEPSSGGPALDGIQSTGIGDLRLEAKTPLAQSGPVALAAIGGITLPTSVGAGGSQFLGDDLPTLRGRLAAQWSRGIVSAGVNAGVILRKPRELYASDVGQQLTYGAAASVAGTRRVAIIGELFGRSGIPAFDQASSPLELTGAVRVRATSDLSVLAGGGGGVMRGIGAPAVRAFVAIGWSPDYADDDADGISNRDDRCPLVSEDRDGFEDSDGCPDDDNDGDMRDDATDRCPNEREDLDGFEDDDGCPDADNDGDGINDLEDRCPMNAEDGAPPSPDDGCPAGARDSDGDGVMDDVDACPEDSEDVDGFLDEDGCPDADNDNDGIADDADSCSLCREDIDGFEDQDGCPDLDNDGDGIDDGEDQCPSEPEVINGVDDFDGCPDSGGAQLVTLEGDKLMFAQLPAFAGGRLRPRRRGHRGSSCTSHARQSRGYRVAHCRGSKERLAGSARKRSKRAWSSAASRQSGSVW